jgi:hypothetical protein
VKLAIIFSCFIGAGIITSYNIVMGQVKDLENFYSHIDEYAQTAVTSNNTVDNPYVPQPLQDVSQPLKQTPLQDFGQ